MKKALPALFFRERAMPFWILEIADALRSRQVTQNPLDDKGDRGMREENHVLMP
jgi:hypothetical protein